MALAALTALALCAFGCLTGWDFDPSDSDVVVVVTGSMDGEPAEGCDVPTIPVGSLVIVEHLPRGRVASVEVGDVLAYDWGGDLVVHRVVAVDPSSETLTLKGDANASTETVTFGDVVGIVKLVYPGLGSALLLIKSPPALVCIAAAVLAIALLAVRDICRIIRDEEERLWTRGN